MAFADARNCPVITAPNTILAKNGIDREAFDRELAAAFAAWSTVANIDFIRVAPANADIVVGAQGIHIGYAFTNVNYVSPPEVNAPAALSRSVICLNPEQSFKVGFDGNLQIYDLRYVLTHEIGHAIGLDHPGRIGELMDFRYQEAFRVPQAGDIAGAVALYGPRRPAVATMPDVARTVSETEDAQRYQYLLRN